jgi:4-amino-4-deoxy-L-arabinose transferase-like glycosyltransferase
LRHLLCVAGLYAAIQICWFVIIPPFEGPDELQHYDHLRYVAVTGHLPDAVPARVNEGGYFTGEWTQEVAYYWMLGQLLRPTGFQDAAPAQSLKENRHSIWTGGSAASVFTHGDPLPPHVAGGLFVGRLASVCFGLGTLLCVFAAVRLITSDILIATLVASCVALVPQFGAQHVFITNDTPATLWASIAAALIVAWLTPAPAQAERRRSWMLAAAIGVATGLAIATKLTAGVIVLAMPLALWLRRREVPWLPPAIAWSAGVLVPAGLAFGRNWILFGDPLATSLKRALVAQFEFRTVFNPRQLASYGDLVKMLFRGIWASIGWGAWTPPDPWISLLFAALTAFLLVCLIIAIRLAFARSTRLPGASAAATPARVREVLLVMLAVFLLHCAAFFVSISMFAGYSARYFLPMIVPFVVMAVIGAQRLFAALRRQFGGEAMRWTMVAMPVLLAAAWIGTFVAAIIAFHFEGLS